MESDLISENDDNSPGFVSHLECSATGGKYEKGKLHGLSDVGKPLLVRYDLPAIKESITKNDMSRRDANLWRYREFLPLRDTRNIVSLGEQVTPLVSIESTYEGKILVKDESRLPTGSFKARGLSVAVSMAKELGVKIIAMPTNGNAGAALAAYCSRAGITSYVFCPEDTPEINIREISIQGGHVWRCDGLIDDCGKFVNRGKDITGWFDASTLKEPYRIEGKKTMGIELAEQLDWTVPDIIFYPTGGGTGLIGMWKAFSELEAIGWIGPERPRMVAVQAQGCAPIVRAYKKGKEVSERWDDARTIASGIRVPAALGDFLILKIVNDSNGFAIAVNDEAINTAQSEVARSSGLLMGPEGAATYAAYKKSIAEGLISGNERVVLFNCGTGLKYPMPPSNARLNLESKVDFRSLITG